MNQIDLAYFAGILDGEGCIRIIWDKRCNTYMPSITVEMSDIEVVEWIASIYPQPIYQVKQRQSHHKISYRWQIKGIKVLPILESLLPYLKAKKDQAEEMLKFPIYSAPGRGRRVPEEILEARHTIYRNLQELKK